METKAIDLFTTVDRVRHEDGRIIIEDADRMEPAAIMSIRQSRILAKAIMELIKEVES